MHSTRKPPFAPPPLPGEEDAREITNVVRLRQGRRNAESDPVQDSDEPPWRQAFVLAEGVKATRTPDRSFGPATAIRKPRRPSRRIQLPLPTLPAVDPSAPSSARRPLEAPEPTVRSQIAELRSALAAEDPVSERLTSLADKEAALADAAGGGEASRLARRMIETATRLPCHTAGPSLRTEAPPESNALRLQNGRCRHALQPGVCSRLILVAGHVLRIGWHPPSGEFGCSVGEPLPMGRCLDDIGVAIDATNRGEAIRMQLPNRRMRATVEAVLPSETIPEAVDETDDRRFTAGEAAPNASGDEHRVGIYRGGGRSQLPRSVR